MGCFYTCIWRAYIIYYHFFFSFYFMYYMCTLLCLSCLLPCLYCIYRHDSSCLDSDRWCLRFRVIVFWMASQIYPSAMVTMYTGIAQSLHAMVRSMLGVLGRVVSFETCCQWALLSVQIFRLFKFTVQNDIYPSVSKVRLGHFVFL